MSKLKLLTISVILLLLANLGLVAFILLKKPPRLEHPRTESMGEEPKKIIAEKLQFNNNQIAQYEGLIKSHQARIKTLNDSIKIVKNILYNTLIQEDFSIKDSLISQIALLQAKIEHTHYNHFIDVKHICLPEQIPNFNALTKELSIFFSNNKKNIPHPKD